MKPISNNIASREQRINNNIRERVRQRLTSYKYLNIYSKKNIVLNFRISMDYLDKLDLIVNKLRARNLSEALRECIDIVYGLLNGAKDVEAGAIVIQNPIVNIVKAESNAKAVSKSETNIDISNKIVIDMDSFNEILNLLNEAKKLINNWYRLGNIPLAAAKTANQSLKKIEKLLKGVN